MPWRDLLSPAQRTQVMALRAAYSRMPRSAKPGKSYPARRLPTSHRSK